MAFSHQLGQALHMSPCILGSGKPLGDKHHGSRMYLLPFHWDCPNIQRAVFGHCSKDVLRGMHIHSSEPPAVCHYLAAWSTVFLRETSRQKAHRKRNCKVCSGPAANKSVDANSTMFRSICFYILFILLEEGSCLCMQHESMTTAAQHSPSHTPGLCRLFCHII